MKHRGLYGQSEGNESRSQAAVMQDIIDDNEVIEGPMVRALRDMIKSHRWEQVKLYCARLLSEGVKQSRIDSMVVRASTRLRF